MAMTLEQLLALPDAAADERLVARNRAAVLSITQSTAQCTAFMRAQDQYVAFMRALDQYAAIMGAQTHIDRQIDLSFRFIDDLFDVRDGDGGVVHAALDRLLGHYFQRGAVFHTRRWALLEPAFQHYRAETAPEGADLSFASAWRALASEALYVAAREVPADLPLPHVYRWLRRHMRTRIERALLHGRTLDQHRYSREEPWPDEDTPEALALEAELAARLGAVTGLTLEQVRLLQQLEPILATLTPLEREALESDASDDASRQRRSRARRKVRAQLQGTAMP